MSKYNLTIFTRYSVSVSIEANSKEEAEEKLWELYNEGSHDPLDDDNADVETNIEYDGEQA
jgi:hypothetical protein